jgi:hypothetical protein
MKGLVNSDAFSSQCKAQLGGNHMNPPNGSVLVWQHLKQIVPVHIVDFGVDSGQGDDGGLAAAQAAAQAAKAHQELVAQVQKEEREFAKGAYKDGNRAVDYYQARLTELKKEYDGIQGKAAADAAHDALRQSFEREKNQFDAGLPVYASKAEVSPCTHITRPAVAARDCECGCCLLPHDACSSVYALLLCVACPPRSC